MSSSNVRVVVCLLPVLALCPASVVRATPLFGSSFTGSQGAVLYDVDPATGHASQPRPTGIDFLVGIAFSPGGTLYGLTNGSASPHPNALIAIDPATGWSTLVGSTGLSNVVEGDLATDPTTGLLYGIYDLAGGQRRLFTMDTATGAATTIPGSLVGDPSAMAFAPDGTLYVIDTSLQELSTVDQTTGQILTTTALSRPLGATAGMNVDPATGVFYVTDGGSGGTDELYVLDPSTAVLTEVGPTGLDTGLAGLAFLPEPTTALLLALATTLNVTRKRRRSSGLLPVGP